MSIEFRQSAEGTDLIFKHEQFFDEAARDGHKRGWSGTLAKLATFLQSTT